MAFKTEDEVIDVLQTVTDIMETFQVNMTEFQIQFDAASDAIKAADDAPEDVPLLRQLEQLKTLYGNVHNGMLELARRTVPVTGRLAGCPSLNNDTRCLADFRQYQQDNNKTFQDRDINKDTATSISGTSAGAGLTVLRSIDGQGDKIDVGHTETLSLVCNKDNSQGATAGKEQFQIVGEDNIGIDPWEEGGSGTNGASYDYPYGIVRADLGSDITRAVSGGIITSVGGSRASGNIIRNGDFESPITGSGTDKLPNWDITTGDAGVDNEVTDPILGAIDVFSTANFVMDQDFTTGAMKPKNIYGIGLKIRGDNGGSGTLTGTLTVKVMDQDEGATHGTLTVDLSTLAVNTSTVVIPILFYNPDTSEDLKVQVELASLGGSAASPQIHIDDVCVAAATLVDGYFIFIYDGTTQNAALQAQGRFKNGDQFDIVTSPGTAGEGLIQEHIYNRPWGRYMRSSESPTWTDPS